MKDHTGCIRQYTIRSESWYAGHVDWERGVSEEVTFGFYAPTGGCTGEMQMVWHTLGGKPTPRLEVFDDAWHTLAQFKDVIDAMAEVDDEHIIPKQFCEILDRCGFRDATTREHD